MLYDECIKLIAEIRDLISDEASDNMYASMMASPEDCLYFAKYWIQRKKGVSEHPDDLSGIFKLAE